MKNWTELVELMDTKVPVKVVSKTNGYAFETEFEIETPEENFLYMFNSTFVGLDAGWEISFARILTAGFGEVSVHDLTGDLDMKASLKVFSGIKKSMWMWLKWVKKTENFKFYFTSKVSDPSRSKLYDKFAKNIANKLKMNLKKSNTQFKEVRWDFWRKDF